MMAYPGEPLPYPAERREDYKTLRRYYGAAEARAMILREVA